MLKMLHQVFNSNTTQQYWMSYDLDDWETTATISIEPHSSMS